MSQILYEPFMRKNGIFKRESIASPPIRNMMGARFPRSPLIHYLPEAQSDTGPDNNWWMVREPDGQVFVDHVQEMTTEFGKVQRVSGSFAGAVQVFHRTHKAMDKITSLATALNNATSTVIVNYGLMQQFYKYGNARNLEFQRNSNARLTLWNNVAKWTTKTDRQQWIPIPVPRALMTPRILMRAEQRFDQEMVNKFSSIEQQFLFDIWQWCGENREKSGLNLIPKEAWGRINLVLTHGQYWTVLNLAQLDPFRRSEEFPKGPMEPLQFQRRMLRGIMALVEFSFLAESATEREEFEKKSEGSDETLQVDDGPTEEELQSPEDQDFWSSEESRISDPTANPLENAALTAPQSNLKSQKSSSSSGSAKSKVVKEPNLDDDSVFDDGSGGTDGNEELTDEAIEKDLSALNDVDLIQSNEVIKTVTNPNKDPLVDGIVSRANQLARDEVISGAEYRRLVAQAERYKQIKNPWGPGLLHEAMQVTEEEVKVAPKKFKVHSERIYDESMLLSTHPELTSKYVTSTMRKHTAQMCMSIQRAGVVVTDYTVEKRETTAETSETYKVKLSPIGGASTTFSFKLPVVKPDGTFTTGGTNYRLSWQRGDIPIRQVNPHRVVLTSFYGKIAVTVSSLQAFNYERWLATAVGAVAAEEGGPITFIRRGNVFDFKLPAPKIHSLLARAFHQITFKDMELNFKHKELLEQYPESAVKVVEKDGSVMVGVAQGKYPVIINKDGRWIVVKEDSVEDRGYWEDMLGIDRSRAPTEVAMMNVLGQPIPLGVVMSYYMGLDNFIRYIRIDHRRVLQGDRMNLEPHESYVKFADETLVYSTRDVKASLLISGFKYYKDELKQLSIYSFDKSHVYVDILDASARNTRYTGELKLLSEMFIDPICEAMLVRMKEPTTWFLLLMRAAELLTTEHSPEEMDGSQMVFRGYNRFPGAVYKEMVKGLRRYNQKSKMSKTGIDIKPTAVWTSITNDPAVRIYDDSNPVQQLRSDEIVTYIGEGGRSKRTMVARTRKMSKNDVGTISEAGVDSGDVGINIYLSANPQILDTYGTSTTADWRKDGPAPLLSTTALLGPGLDVDDTKRIVFSSIQHGSGIAAVGYRPLPYRTGMDEVLAHRAGEKYAYTALGSGEVVSVKGGVLKVRYDDGTIAAVEVGRIYTKGAGHTYPADIALTVKVGDHVSEGEVLAYNTSWFEPDYFNPRHVIYKAGVMMRVALFEASVTHEDSSEISLKMTETLKTHETDQRPVWITFDTELAEVAQEGQTVDTDSILCVMEDSTSRAADMFDDSSIDSLKLLTGQNPKAGTAGVIDRIEVIYNGDIEDMSPSLRNLVEETDAKIAKKSKALGRGASDGRNNESLRIGGNPLQLNTASIIFHITYENDAFTGDKVVFANQMKSVIGGVMTGINETESGLVLDAKFSDTSNEARLVRSSRKAGMNNSLILRAGRNFSARYRGLM